MERRRECQSHTHTHTHTLTHTLTHTHTRTCALRDVAAPYQKSAAIRAMEQAIVPWSPYAGMGERVGALMADQGAAALGPNYQQQQQQMLQQQNMEAAAFAVQQQQQQQQQRVVPTNEVVRQSIGGLKPTGNLFQPSIEAAAARGHAAATVSEKRLDKGGSDRQPWYQGWRNPVLPLKISCPVSFVWILAADCPSGHWAGGH